MTNARPVTAKAAAALPGGARPPKTPAFRTTLERLWRSQRRTDWVLTALVVLIAVAAGNSVARNDNFEWGVVGDYLFSRPLMLGLGRTLQLTGLSTAVGFVLGVVLAVMRLSRSPLPVAASSLYIWFFRGTPLLVQLVFWFNLGALYQQLSLGIPFGPTLLTGDANDLITPMSAAVLGLGLNAGAYMSEIVRAGIQSIHHGQTEAAQAMGLSGLATMRYVVLPQAMRVIVPPIANEVISMLKYSSLVSVLAVPELLYSAQLIYARNFKTIPLLITISVWYLAITTVLTIFQHFLERRYARGVRVAGRSRSATSATAIEPGADIPGISKAARPAGAPPTSGEDR
ncbi:amino acid ABC transporter permease [Actinomadura graeca]|uniref:Amino acid ABC transporter permease n=1 Tax=Actinomadura graeca TaxID=2750812 RepID=A0ABX8QUE0_9ACTN|nr:amino acid ABC transporter permease [Actinomadura graeca]QXJ21352.1 amino acid ABC transporter permease [Actinomadura graeca]